jgi:hypothetical protein
MTTKMPNVFEDRHAWTLRRPGVDPLRDREPLTSSPASSGGQTVPSDESKELVRRLVDEVVNKRDPDALDELAQGRLAKLARRWISPFRSSFPDFGMEIVELVAEDDKRSSATSSALAPIAASGWASRPQRGASRTSTRSTSSRSETESCRAR